MRFAIPTAEGKLCLHFGHAQAFVLLDVDPDSKEIKTTQTLTPPVHQPGVLPQWMHEQGVNVVIAGGMGVRAQQLLMAKSIEVVPGAPALEPELLVQQYLSKALKTGDNACSH